MSADDVLSRAKQAARHTVDRVPADADSGRARLMAAAVAQRRRGRMVRALAPAVLGVLVCSSAWAAATGRLSLPAVFRAAPTAAPPAAGSRVHTPIARHDAEQRLAVEPPLGVESAPPVVAVVVPRIETARNTHTTASPGATTATSESAPASAPAHHAPPPAHAVTSAEPPEADGLYAAAHHAHFVARDPGAALRAWDAYLAAAPSGRYAPEARYNRALSLIRLGQRAQGRAALAPFAAGRYGGYRQADARRLLEVLDGP